MAKKTSRFNLDFDREYLETRIRTFLNCLNVSIKSYHEFVNYKLIGKAASIRLIRFPSLKNSSLELSLHPSEIETRLRDIPVYALVDNESQIYLIKGKQKKILCPFFIRKNSAEIFHEKLKIISKDMAKCSRVVEIGLDQYYKCVVSNSKKLLYSKAVTFRLIPDPREVENALKLLKTSERANATIPQKLDGVPLFQIESLEVKIASETIRAMPLFFTKDDADLALMASYSAKKERQKIQANEAIKLVNKKIEKFENIAELSSVNENNVLQSCSFKSFKFERHLENAKKRLDQEHLRLERAYLNGDKPCIQVGCLEWVIQQMEEDTKGLWSEIVFIPPGYFHRTNIE
jgi:hypothetical protein